MVQLLHYSLHLSNSIVERTSRAAVPRTIYKLPQQINSRKTVRTNSRLLNTHTLLTVFTINKKKTVIGACHSLLRSELVSYEWWRLTNLIGFDCYVTVSKFIMSAGRFSTSVIYSLCFVHIYCGNIAHLPFIFSEMDSQDFDHRRFESFKAHRLSCDLARNVTIDSYVIITFAIKLHNTILPGKMSTKFM